MKLKRHIEFLNESISIHKGSFKVTKDMVSNGMLIKELIPREVHGSFHCTVYNLISLKGCPEIVTGSFYCYNNLLTSLEGCPKAVGGNFDCTDNKLVSLEGGPKTVGGDFDCTDNSLTSLEGCPKEINRSFYCSNNELTSLEGGPKKVTGGFYSSGNKINLDIEMGYITSDFINGNYYLGLLKYMIDKGVDLEEVKGWPKDFITDNTIQSVKGISKFQL